MKYFGFYRGTVMQCLNNGFCRIQVPDILECVNGDVNTLPVAEQAQSIGGGANTNNGTFTYPELGSIVWCFFEGGNLERPVYFASSNPKSPFWDSVSIPTASNTNHGIDGVSEQPAGRLFQYNKSAIAQKVVLDKESGLPIGDSIDIVVYPTAEQENMYNQALANDQDNIKMTAPVAASIHLDNKGNMLTLSAKNTLILRAPKIIIDSTGFEQPGYLMLNSNETDNMTNNGPFRIMESKVNIDGGSNDIVMQTTGNIYQLKVNKSDSQEEL